MKAIKHLIKFLTEDIWRITPSEVSGVRYLYYEIIKKLILAIQFFTNDRVMTRAAALTYSTMLATVPILSVVFGIARGFGLSKYIEVWFRDVLAGQEHVANTIIGFTNSYLVHAKSGIFLGFGLVLMLWTVMLLTNNIEITFNEIWQVKKCRSLFRTITDYLTMFFLLPILIVISTGISIYMTTVVKQLPDFLLLGPMMQSLIDLSPYVMMSAVFVALYLFMPNTKVKLTSVLIPGILAGCAFQGLQYFYIHSQIWVSQYNAIYGSFAAIPLFMLWAQISWSICLFGAELCYANQNVEEYNFREDGSNISHRCRIMISSLLMSIICKRFAEGKQAYTALELSRLHNIPIRLTTDIIYNLLCAHLIVEVTNDSKGALSVYMPAMDVNKLNVGVMIDRLEAYGKESLMLDYKKLYNDNWKRLISIRKTYLNQQSDILLKDL
jgi:membrane protein